MRALTAVVCAAALAGGTAVAPAHAAGCKQVKQRGKGWSTIAMPAFPQRLDDDVRKRLQDSNLDPYTDGLKTPVAIAADQWTAGVLYLTNAKAVLRSADGGCTWTEVFNILDYDDPLAPLTRSDNPRYAVLSVKTPAARSAHRRVYVLLHDRDTGRIGVARSESGTGGWTFSNLGLSDQQPTTAWGAELAIAPAHPNVVYVAAQLRTYGTQYFRSDDGGATWSTFPAADVGKWNDQSGYRIVVNPLNPRELWDGYQSSCGYGAFRHSSDGGATWNRVPIGDPDSARAIPVAAFVPRGSRTVHVYAIWCNTRLYWSEDGGRTFPNDLSMPFQEPGHDPLLPGPGNAGLYGGGYTNGVQNEVKPAFGFLSRAKAHGRTAKPWVDLSPRYNSGKQPYSSEGLRGHDWFVSDQLARRTFYTLTPLSIERYSGPSS